MLCQHAGHDPVENKVQVAGRTHPLVNLMLSEVL